MKENEKTATNVDKFIVLFLLVLVIPLGVNNLLSFFVATPLEPEKAVIILIGGAGIILCIRRIRRSGIYYFSRARDFQWMVATLVSLIVVIFAVEKIILPDVTGKIIYPDGSFDGIFGSFCLDMMENNSSTSIPYRFLWTQIDVHVSPLTRIYKQNEEFPWLKLRVGRNELHVGQTVEIKWSGMGDNFIWDITAIEIIIIKDQFSKPENACGWLEGV